jgi:hypothetical protein
MCAIQLCVGAPGSQVTAVRESRENTWALVLTLRAHVVDRLPIDSVSFQHRLTPLTELMTGRGLVKVTGEACCSRAWLRESLHNDTVTYSQVRPVVSDVHRPSTGFCECHAILYGEVQASA